jgi:single-strand DNA-binding protein
MNLNSVTFVGRLTSNPTFHKSEDNDTTKDHAMFRLAVNRSFNKDQADFFNCVAWDGLARAIVQYCKKGKEVGVNGSIHIDTAKREDGSWDTRVEVLCMNVSFGRDPAMVTTGALKAAPVSQPKVEAPPAPKSGIMPDIAALLKDPQVLALLAQAAGAVGRAVAPEPSPKDEDFMTFTADGDDYPV